VAGCGFPARMCHEAEAEARQTGLCVVSTSLSGGAWCEAGLPGWRDIPSRYSEVMLVVL